jgi:hypothetical protein
MSKKTEIAEYVREMKASKGLVERDILAAAQAGETVARTLGTRVALPAAKFYAAAYEVTAVVTSVLREAVVRASTVEPDLIDLVQKGAYTVHKTVEA